MRRKQTETMLALALAVGLLCWGISRQEVEAQSANTDLGSVGVVNVQRVFDSLEERQAIQNQLKSKMQQLHAENQNLEREIKTLRAELEMLREGTEDYERKRTALMRKQVELKAWQSLKKQEFARQNAKSLEELYQKVIKSTERVARENGFLIALFKEKPDVSSDKPKEVGNKIFNRKLVWSDPAVNITDKVITKMNLEYANR